MSSGFFAVHKKLKHGGIMKNVVLWDVALCRSCVNRRFGGRRHSLRCENLKSYMAVLLLRSKGKTHFFPSLSGWLVHRYLKFLCQLQRQLTHQMRQTVSRYSDLRLGVVRSDGYILWRTDKSPDRDRATNNETTFASRQQILISKNR
jgi:hypothetical protein